MTRKYRSKSVLTDDLKQSTTPADDDTASCPDEQMHDLASLANQASQKRRGPKPKPPRLFYRAARGTHAASWIIVYEGDQTYLGTDDADEAKAKLAEFEDWLRNPDKPERQPIKTILEDVMKHTAKGRQAPLRRLLAFYGNRRVGDITQDLSDDYVYFQTLAGDPTQNGAPFEPGTLRNDVKAFKRYINIACQALDPTFSLAIKLPPAGMSRERFLTYDEYQRMIGAAKGHVFDVEKNSWRTDPQTGEIFTHDAETCALREPLERFIKIATWTGSRLTVVEDCRWQRTKSHSYMAMGRGVFVRACEVDGQTTKRATPCKIIDHLSDDLKRWQKEDAALGFDRVIHTAAGGRVWQLDRIWKRIVADAGLDASVIRHTLRYTCVTWLSESDVDVDEAADFVGMSRETFLNIYSQVRPHFAIAAADALDSRNFGREDPD